MVAVAWKTTTCTHCGATAHLYTWPSKDAGIWECGNCSTTGECEHPETHPEDVIVERFGNDMEAMEWDEVVQVCNECGITIEDHEEIIKGDCGA